MLFLLAFGLFSFIFLSTDARWEIPLAFKARLYLGTFCNATVIHLWIYAFCETRPQVSIAYICCIAFAWHHQRPCGTRHISSVFSHCPCLVCNTCGHTHCRTSCTKTSAHLYGWVFSQTHFRLWTFCICCTASFWLSSSVSQGLWDNRLNPERLAGIFFGAFIIQSPVKKMPWSYAVHQR